MTGKKEAQLMLTNSRDAFRGQSRSPNTASFHMLGIIIRAFVRRTMSASELNLRRRRDIKRKLLCNSNFVIKTRRFSDIRLQKMS